MTSTAADLAFISPSYLGYVSVALDDLFRRMSRNDGIDLPKDLVELVGFFRSHASGRQSTPEMDGLAEWLQSVDEPKLLTDREGAAHMLDVSLRTIDRMIESGDLDPVHIGSSCRLRISDIRSIAAKGA